MLLPLEAEGALGVLPAGSGAPPVILMVGRRHVRKNKLVDFAGEYHLDLLVGHGALPLIYPRVLGMAEWVRVVLPFVDGLLLVEGEDLSPEFFVGQRVSPELGEQVRDKHPSDAAFDLEKDKIEFRAVEWCLRQGVPILGICRGAQVLNVVSGGSLWEDVELQVGAGVRHIDYGNYDGLRHEVKIVRGSALDEWFGGRKKILVSSYHHQGIRTLGKDLVDMGTTNDGLIEAFCKGGKDGMRPDLGKFCVGLQFHPERMQDAERALKGEKPEYEYEGCKKVFRDFVAAAKTHRRMRSKK